MNDTKTRYSDAILAAHGVRHDDLQRDAGIATPFGVAFREALYRVDSTADDLASAAHTLERNMASLREQIAQGQTVYSPYTSASVQELHTQLTERVGAVARLLWLYNQTKTTSDAS